MDCSPEAVLPEIRYSPPHGGQSGATVTRILHPSINPLIHMPLLSLRRGMTFARLLNLL